MSRTILHYGSQISEVSEALSAGGDRVFRFSLNRLVDDVAD